MVKVVDSESEFYAILKDAAVADKLVVVDFFAEWCGPCKMLAPKLNELSQQNSEVVFLKVDVDKLQDLSAKFGITAMPTVLFIKKEQEIDKVVGANLPQIQANLAKHAPVAV